MKRIEAAQKLLDQCLGLREGERVFIVCDECTHGVAQALFQASLLLKASPQLLQVTALQLSDGEPPSIVASGLVQADVALCPTSKSMTHTEAVRSAYRKGVRVASMPGITEAMLNRTLGADYAEIQRKSRGLAQIVDQGKRVKVTTELGTHISFSIEGRSSIADVGDLREAGRIGNIPAGEVFLAPVEGTAEGVAVINRSITSLGRLKKTVRIVVSQGSAMEIIGGNQAAELLEKLKEHEPEAKMLAEFGIGTNPTAKISGVALEDEKVLGTAHIAFGKNSSFGGGIECPIHIDCIFSKPSIEIDETVIMRKGKLLI